MEEPSSMSIKALKAALNDLKMGFSDCNEKHELVSRLVQARAMHTTTDQQTQGTSSHRPDTVPQDLDLDTTLAKLNNLLDTLPAALALLDKKWSEARSEKTRGQLASIKSLLDQSAAAGTTNPNWQAKLAEYNEFARDYKRLRDMPRSMNG